MKLACYFIAVVTGSAYCQTFIPGRGCGVTKEITFSTELPTDPSTAECISILDENAYRKWYNQQRSSK